MILVPCEQGSPQWLSLRLGLVTASRCKDACERLKSGAPSQKAIAYAAQVAFERVTGTAADDTFVSFAMRRGTELEPMARIAYEAHTGNLIEEAGIAFTDDRRFGYSTDGYAADDGAICPLSALTVITVWRTRDLSEYMHQMQMGLWITGRQWIDFVMFDPRLKPVGKEFFIERVRRDEGLHRGHGGWPDVVHRAGRRVRGGATIAVGWPDRCGCASDVGWAPIWAGRGR